MMTSAAMTAPPRRRGVIGRERAIRFLFGAMIFLGFFVFVEPAPFDLLAVVFIPVVLFTGFRLNGLLLTLSVILLLYNLGGFMSLAPWWHESVSVIFTVLSLYLAILCVFLAAFFAQDPVPRAELCMKAYTASAIVVAITGIMGYFNVFGLFETLTLYGRAKGTFKDPNVYGPYLALGALYLMQLLALNRTRHVLATVVMLAVILFGLLLSFSRGAWGGIVVGSAAVLAMSYATTDSKVLRLRIVMGCFLVLVVSALILALALSIDEVAKVFADRFVLQKDYDSGPSGRFGNQLRAFPELLDRPFGYGPNRHGLFFPENPHNVYMMAFSSYGWLGGLTFIGFIGATLYIAFRNVFARTPFQAHAIVISAALIPHILQGFQIDSDRWRHLFYLYGVAWGIAGANRSWMILNGRKIAGPERSPGRAAGWTGKVRLRAK